MAGNKYLERNASTGEVGQVEGLQVSAGAGDAGKIPALNSVGVLDETLMPLGIGPNIVSLVTTEDLVAGNYVNIFLDSGVAKFRLADASNGRPAHGFVKAAFLTGATAIAYDDVTNNNLSGLTIGSRYYLSTAGGVTATPRTSGLHQFLGKAISATAISSSIDDHINLV